MFHFWNINEEMTWLIYTKKRRDKHLWKSYIFSKVPSQRPAILLKISASQLPGFSVIGTLFRKILKLKFSEVHVYVYLIIYNFQKLYNLYNYNF